MATPSLNGLHLDEAPTNPEDVFHIQASLDSVNPIDKYRTHIAEELSKLTSIPAADIEPRIQWTSTLDKGDLTLAVPALRIKGKPPAELASELATSFPPSDLIEPPTTEGTFLKFFYKRLPLIYDVLPQILKEKAVFGTNARMGLRDPSDIHGPRKRMLIDMSSPNIAKPFHAGHLRSTIIGGFIGNLHETLGWKVIRYNYLGDWGRQFGLLAVAFDMFGDEAKLKGDPIGHLFDIYVQINNIAIPEEKAIKAKQEEIEAAEKAGKPTEEMEAEVAKMEAASTNEKARAFFVRMEKGDAAALAIWSRFRDLSIAKYKQTYARLNIEYAEYSGESQVGPEYMNEAVKTLEGKNLLEESKGAMLIDFTKDPKTKKLGKALVRQKNGATLYFTRDLGEYLKRKREYDLDKNVYVVASQQDLHLAQLFKAIELMGDKEFADKSQHINFGMVLGMSTRKGTVKFLDDILRDVGDHMHDVMRSNEDKYAQVENPTQIADILGITAVMVQDMSGKRINNYEFSLERMCSFEGDTGPYLQYAHARLCSIARKAQVAPAAVAQADLSLLKETHAINLVRLLASWPDVVLNTAKTLEPVTVLTYLFKMTHMLSSSYDVLKVIGSEEDVKAARMALYESARQVLNNGMRLLGLTPVERM